MMWVNPELYADKQLVFSQKATKTNNSTMLFRLGGPDSEVAPPYGIRMSFYSNDLDTSDGIIKDNKWYHLTFWYDFETRTRRIYVNGKQEAEDNGKDEYFGTAGDTILGSCDSMEYFKGIIDEVRIYDRPVTENEIINAMAAPIGYEAVYHKDKLTTTWGRMKNYE